MGRIWMPGGGGGADLDVITAEADDILDGKVIVDKEGNPLSGRMPNNGEISKELLAGESYTVPKGYHNGNGSVTAKDLASQTSANALASDIRKNKRAWANGLELIGSMNEKAAATYTPRTYAQNIAANQYLTGAQTISGDINLIASNIKKGVTIFGVPGTFEGFVAGPADLYKYGNNAANFMFNPIEMDSTSQYKPTATFETSGIYCATPIDNYDCGRFNARNATNFHGYTKINFEIQNLSSTRYFKPNFIYLMNSAYTGNAIYPPNYWKQLPDISKVEIAQNANGTLSIPLTGIGSVTKYLTFILYTEPRNTQFVIKRIWLS